MAVFFLVVLHLPPLHAFLDDVQREMDMAVVGGRGGTHGHLQRGERMSAVAIADFGKECARIGIQIDGRGAVAARFVLERVIQQATDRFRRKGMQLEDERAAGERRIDEHGRVVRRRADQHDRAVLHIGQQHILLRLVEAVDFVHEQNRAHAAQLVARALADLANLRDVRDDTGTAHEVALRGFGDHFRERRLAAARRTVEDDVGQAIGLDDAPQELAGAQDMLLPDNLVQRARPHPRRQRFCVIAVHGAYYTIPWR